MQILRLATTNEFAVAWAHRAIGDPHQSAAAFEYGTQEPLPHLPLWHSASFMHVAAFGFSGTQMPLEQ